jgi:ankyrin repeat protein
MPSQAIRALLVVPEVCKTAGARNVDGDTALSLACRFADAPTLHMLLRIPEVEKTAGEKAPSGSGMTPLMEACQYRSGIEVAALLLCENVRRSADAQTIDGITALMLAVMFKKADCVKVLLADGHVQKTLGMKDVRGA